MELQSTLRSLADLVFDVEKHEILADLDEEEHIRRIEALRADIAKGNRIADANERLFEEGVAELELRQTRAREEAAPELTADSERKRPNRPGDKS